MVMIDDDKTQEIKDRLADRYTASDLCDLLDIPVEDIIQEYWDRILRRSDILVEVGAEQDEDIEDYSDDTP